MKHPPYFLRFNKAADRFALIEAIKRLGKLGSDLSEYTYISLGGPYLEDFRLMYEFSPEITMISVEKDEQTCKRQEFHLPCGKVTLVHNDMNTFITQYDPKDKKAIFWLDYTGLEPTHLLEFKMLLGKIVSGSMIKITLQADPSEYREGSWSERQKNYEIFRRKFGEFMPDPFADPPLMVDSFVGLVEKMIQIAVEQALPATATPLKFQPISSFYYSDNTLMLTLTGIVWPRTKISTIKKAFAGWEFLNLTWLTPKHIQIPVLSTKERLHLQPILPCGVQKGATLRQKLGYLVDLDIEKTEAALEQYAAFHRYSPYFIQSIP
jgi:hypothetical protein